MKNEFTLKLCSSISAINICSNDTELIEYLLLRFGNFVETNTPKKGSQHTVDVYINSSIDTFVPTPPDYIQVRDGIISSKSSKGELTNLILRSFFSTDKLYKSIFREIRDFLHSLLIKNKFILLHAACVSRNDKGYCIVGDKFAGKTTLLIKLLQNDFNLVSNDKVYVKMIGSQAKIISLPINAGIRMGTIKTNKDLQSKIIKHLSDEDIEFSSDSRVHISPKLLSTFFSIKFMSESNLEQVVYLKTNYSNVPILHSKKLVENIDRNILQVSDNTLKNEFLNTINICEFTSTDEALCHMVSSF